MDFTTAHLGLDYRDCVWLLDADGDPVTNLGHVDSDPEWPTSEGSEPTWFLTECNELLDRWEDAGRLTDGCREAARSGYLNGIGAL